MRIPGPPDWLIYFSATVLVMFLANSFQERADAPPAPPPPPGEAALPLDPALPFNPVGLTAIHGEGLRSGAAFSAAEPGQWLTTLRLVQNCPKTVLVVGEGKGVVAAVAATPAPGLAMLTTKGGAPALVPATRLPKIGERGFLAGFPQNHPGEATVRYLGTETLPGRRRGEPAQTALVWAESGRTEGLEGSLAGLAGGPVMDSSGAVFGVILGEAPRRGRLYSTSPATLAKAMPHNSAATIPGEPVTIENYGRVADALRRDLRVAKIVCLKS
jgi:serine protease Do